MSDLLAEVDEIMRQERMAKLWKSYGGWLIGFILTVILATAAVSGYKTWDKAQKIKSTDSLLMLVQDQAFPANIDKAHLEQMRAGPKAIAQLSAAAAYKAQGQDQEALNLYKQIGQDSAAPADLKKLAQFQTILLSSAPVQDRLSNLSTLAEDLDNPWRYQAHLQMAVLLADEKNDPARALAHLDVVLRAPALPSALYEQANALVHLYKIRLEQKGKQEE